MGLWKCQVLTEWDFLGLVIRGATHTDCLAMGSQDGIGQTAIRRRNLLLMPPETPALREVERKREYMKTSWDKVFNVSETPTLQEKG